ncbi:DUF2642 domain-containing protein [Geobacillus thermodenitrificans]|jgi:hypothetical protein|uniref:DUF2642 domain-containing protein n=2 Tax=Geobacillus thermodenitrificans TaxID=33940 RepID=A4INL0_GEOTN|nr:MULTISPECIES: hypothetical protein [Geobacillus]ABO66914.1 Conserved hypothetical protein [Geobacillus thermodenitrificans NG80-2]ARP42683.1 hypothetical protein GTHT12_01130 [Geobacillus thermodenitrificans]ATO36015.1 DUF2642 domain-containing protein [Geobacillus thermodenitrificans]OQP11126.1 DUF2642 domain-containing protein [Geobacillus sp. 47C-IIb]QNU31311.1 DUF2642 domain-containing protein [Geobacillus sp. 47C-IIb]
MDLLKTLLGKQVKVEISGGTTVRGVLIDLGLDILVIYTGKEYLYIPHLHIHHIQLYTDPEFLITPPFPDVPLQEDAGISYRKTLLNAKGRFVEVYVIGNKSIHGYITNVLNDYFTFYSPVYKTMLISMNHLKWLTPYQKNITPYTLGNDALPVQPTPLPLQRSLEGQLKKMEGHLVIFDLGDHPMKIGLLKEVKNNIIHLVTASGESVYWKVIHLKTVHFPS